MSKTSIKERIRRGGPTKQEPVWIGAPLELIEAYERACKEAEDAERPADSLAGTGSTGDIETRIAQLRAELEDYVVVFTLRGLDDKRYQKIREEHPPRKDDEGKVHDRDGFGFNYETFPPALVRACTVTPELDDEDWVALFGDEQTQGSLTGAQVDSIGGVAMRLCTRDVDVPFWSAASATNRA